MNEHESELDRVQSQMHLNREEISLEEDIDLLDYVEIIVRRRWMIFLIVFFCAIGSYIYALLQPEIFQASAIILPADERDYLKFGDPQKEVNRRSFYLDILKSTSLNRNIIQKSYHFTLDDEQYEMTLLEYFGVETIQQGKRALLGMTNFVSDPSGVISIAVKSRSPELSASLANQYVDQLELYNKERQQAHFRSKILFIETRMDELQKSLAQAEEEISDFQKGKTFLRDIGGVDFLTPNQSVEYSRLKRAVDIRSSLLSTVMNQYEVVQVETKKEVSEIEILNYAEPPESGSTLGKKKTVMISSFSGFFVAIFLAFLLEYIERNRQSGRLDPIVEELRKDIKTVKRFLRNPGLRKN